MRNQVQNLSENSRKLYDILLQTGGGWEQSLMEIMFPKPVYAKNPEARRAVWQYEANAFGHPTPERVVVMPEESSDGKGVFEVFQPQVPVSYFNQVSQAYQELRKAGLAGERNSGYNDYWLYPIKR